MNLGTSERFFSVKLTRDSQTEHQANVLKTACSHLWDSCSCADHFLASTFSVFFVHVHVVLDSADGFINGALGDLELVLCCMHKQ